MLASPDSPSVLSEIGDFLLSRGGILTAAIGGLFEVFGGAERNRKWKILTIGGILAGTIWALASSYYEDSQQTKKTNETLQKVNELLSKSSKETANTIEAYVDSLVRTLGAKRETAQNATLSQIHSWAEAGKLSETAVGQIPQNQRQQLTIWVFPHAQNAVNFDVVKSRLQQVAAHVESHSAIEGIAPANSVWYTGGLLPEAKSAALIVTAAGIQIRQICPAQKVALPSLIQIGGSARAETLPVLTPDDIQVLSSPVCAQ